MSDFILQAKEVTKTYQEGKLSVDVLYGINLELSAGQGVAIVGSSGSGKSTLLNVLGGLDTPTHGSVNLSGQDFAKLSEKKKGTLRNHKLGFIYQFHHLLPEFSALENVSLPLVIQGKSIEEAEDAANELLKKVGLAKRVWHKPGELSGGERQRAAVARALVTKPDCLLADEPTGNLDPKIAEQVFQVLLELKQEMNTSIIMVTHDYALAERMDITYRLDEGVLTTF